MDKTPELDENARTPEENSAETVINNDDEQNTEETQLMNVHFGLKDNGKNDKFAGPIETDRVPTPHNRLTK